MHEICQFVDSEALGSLALASRMINEITNRRLWENYQLHTNEAVSIDGFVDRLQALLRIRPRSACVRNLIIGPITWKWNSSIIQRLPDLWAAVPFLTHLQFASPIVKPKGECGGFSPVIHSLLQHGSHLQLKCFRWDHSIRSNSILEMFLRSQPTIKEIGGLKISRSCPPTLDPGFLPSLREVADDGQLIARLIPIREIVYIHHQVPPDNLSDLDAILDALGASQSLSLRVFAPLAYLAIPSDQRLKYLRRIVSVAPNLTFLHAQNFVRHTAQRRIVGKLQFLEDLFCWCDLSKMTPKLVNRWASPLGKRLRRITFVTREYTRMGIWEREINGFVLLLPFGTFLTKYALCLA